MTDSTRNLYIPENDFAFHLSLCEASGFKFNFFDSLLKLASSIILLGKPFSQLAFSHL